MWKRLFEFGKLIASLTQKSREHEADIKQLQQDVKDVRLELRAVSEMLQLLRVEFHNERDVQARDRENLVLRLENTLLKFERRLPSPANPPKELSE